MLLTEGNCGSVTVFMLKMCNKLFSFPIFFGGALINFSFSCSQGTVPEEAYMLSAFGESGSSFLFLF